MLGWSLGPTVFSLCTMQNVEECLARGWSVTEPHHLPRVMWVACGSGVRGIDDRVMWKIVRRSVCQRTPSGCGH